MNYYEDSETIVTEDGILLEKSQFSASECESMSQHLISHLIKWKHQPSQQSSSLVRTIARGVRTLYLTKIAKNNTWNKFVKNCDINKLYIIARNEAINEMKQHSYLTVPPMIDSYIYDFEVLSNPLAVQEYLDKLPCPKDIPHNVIPEEFYKHNPQYRK